MGVLSPWSEWVILISKRPIQTANREFWTFLGVFPRECVGFSYFEFLIWAGFDT